VDLSGFDLKELNIIFYGMAYILGSIPFGLILAKVFAKVDVRESGSGNIGATNVLRVIKEKDPKLAKKISLATLLLDAFKGIFVLILAKLMDMPEATLWGIAVLAVVGHTMSIFLFFEGGKGVATGLGVLTFMLPIEGIMGLLVWLFFGKILKISSIASLFSIIGILISSYFVSPEIIHVPVGIITAIIFYKHLPNIERLIMGNETAVLKNQ
jgi:glycerol-3-phosphate acyltransferase PlsY